MTPTQFRRVRELFEQALQAEPTDVGAWLNQHADDDREVHAEVAALLNYHSRTGSFLTEPLAARVPNLLEEQSALEPGVVIGTYTIVREIGRGGMGHVYLATDTRLGRQVALKVLPPRLTSEEAQRERLRREAQAAAALSHPGICTVFALEEVSGELFIVSEYVEGHTLREEIVRRTRPSSDDVRETAREIADALASAHAKGITHRDLKPENIMRGADGRLKILDFGLARFDRRVDETVPAQLTRPGMFIGTPAYMAPEQVDGKPADARSDVFAFGILMYEYASGVHPFDADSVVAVAARVLQSEVTPLDERCPALSPTLVGIIERCLRKAPADRFASAAEIVAALARGDRAPKRGAALTWWRRHQIIVIGMYLLASTLGWLIKEWQHGLADTMFLLVGAAATAGGIFRGHLLFTERVNGDGFGDERTRARPITVGIDLLVAAALLTDGVLVANTRPLAAVLTFALALGIALTVLVVEPATTRAAFGSRTKA